MGHQQAVHERLQAISFLDDHLGVFTQFRTVQFPFKQLCRPSESPKRIFDFMRQITNERAIGFCLRIALRLSLDAQLLVYRSELNKQLRI